MLLCSPTCFWSSLTAASRLPRLAASTLPRPLAPCSTHTKGGDSWVDEVTWVEEVTLLMQLSAKQVQT